MNIYHLTRLNDVLYDENESFVIADYDTYNAMALANDNCADEGRIWMCDELIKVTPIGTYIGEKNTPHIIQV